MDGIDEKNRREYELWKNQGENKEGQMMLTEMRNERLQIDQSLRKNKENENYSSFLPQLYDKSGKVNVK